MSEVESPPAEPKSPRRCFRLTPDRLILGLLALECMLWLSERVRWPPWHKGYALLTVIGAAATAIVFMVFWFAVALVFRRRFQFSIRSLLVLTVAIAVPCSWLAVQLNRAREQASLVTEIKELEGRVIFDWQYDPSGKALPNATPPKSNWLRNLLGEDYFADVIEVSFLSSAPVLASNRHSFESWAGMDAERERLEGMMQLRTDVLLDHLEALTHLVTLSLDGTRVTDAGLERLQGLRHLRHLYLSNTRLTGPGLRHLKGLPQLRWLILDGSQITDAGLKYVRGLTQLEELRLNDTQVTDVGLEHFERLTQLRTLLLGGTRVTDAGLQHLKGLTQLQGLSLERTQITDAGLEHLKGLTQLRALGLGDTRVTDAGLQHLKGLTQLRTLPLGRTQVTDAGLEHLNGLTQLQALFLDGTRVTNAGVENLRKALPNCKIYWSQ